MGGGGATGPPSPPAEAAKPFQVDRALQALGFEFTRVTAGEVAGRLPVTETCCQVRTPRRRSIDISFCFPHRDELSRPGGMRARVALRLAQRRRVGAHGGGHGEHRLLRRLGLPEAGRRAALHQPRRPRAARRPRRGHGHAHPARPQNPGTTSSHCSLLDQSLVRIFQVEIQVTNSSSTASLLIFLPNFFAPQTITYILRRKIRSAVV